MKTLACLIVTAMVDSSAVCSLTIDSLLVFACNQLRFDSGFFTLKEEDSTRISLLASCASVVQGSGVGPSEYDVHVSDLPLRNAFNTFVEFADDT